MEHKYISFHTLLKPGYISFMTRYNYNQIGSKRLLEFDAFFKEILHFYIVLVQNASQFGIFLVMNTTVILQVIYE